jgi:uncharacterized protein
VPSAKIVGVPRAVPVTILLPPSEGKAEGGDGPPWSPATGRFGGALARQREQVIAALAAAGGGSPQLLGVGGRHLARASAANAALVGAPTLPAALRYTGVVWDHLGPATLPAAARRRAATSVVVVSGLLGLAGFDDPVPDYRLKMGANLAPLGVLARWWRPALTAALDDETAGRVVVDLLPKEHAGAWQPAGRPVPARRPKHLRVRFVGGDGLVAGHDAKAAKGLLARHLLIEGGDPRRALDSFRHPRFAVEVV